MRCGGLSWTRVACASRGVPIDVPSTCRLTAFSLLTLRSESVQRLVVGRWGIISKFLNSTNKKYFEDESSSSSGAAEDGRRARDDSASLPCSRPLEPRRDDPSPASRAKADGRTRKTNSVFTVFYDLRIYIYIYEIYEDTCNVASREPCPVRRGPLRVGGWRAAARGASVPFVHRTSPRARSRAPARGETGAYLHMRAAGRARAHVATSCQSRVAAPGTRCVVNNNRSSHARRCMRLSPACPC